MPNQTHITEILQIFNVSMGFYSAYTEGVILFLKKKSLSIYLTFSHKNLSFVVI